MAEMEKPASDISSILNFLPSLPGTVNEYGLGYIRMSNAEEGLVFYGHEGGYPGSTTYMFYWQEGDVYISLNANMNADDMDKYILIPVERYLKKRL